MTIDRRKVLGLLGLSGAAAGEAAAQQLGLGGRDRQGAGQGGDGQEQGGLEHRRILRGLPRRIGASTRSNDGSLAFHPEAANFFGD